MKALKHIFLAILAAAGCPLADGNPLTGRYAPTATPALPPAEAQKAFIVPEGFEVRLFAAEPEVVNPVAMTWDERGRLWVVELYEYPLGAAPGTKPRDRVRILEDTDNDGRADKAKVFADGLNLATGILIGNGGVYVGQAPDLLFLEDTNGDDIADKRTVLLTGFGLHDRHETLNGFTWGPDGWLYMTHGVFTHSKVKIPEATEPGVEMNAAVARFHPRTKKFEVFADGTSNPWGVDFDRYGNAFVSACVIDHLFHMTPGGIYQRQAGTPANPYAYELLPSIVDHKHHLAAYCGVCVYEGDQFPAEYRGRVFFGNIHQNAINHDRLLPNGSSFKAVAEPDLVTTTDGWFRPVSQQVGPDGALWIADWYDKYPCYQNAQADPGGVNRTHGRIWRVVYTGNKPGTHVGSRPDTKMDLKKVKGGELVKLLRHPNVWHRRTAQRLLSERADGRSMMSEQPGKLMIKGDGKVKSALEKLATNGKTADARLTALWTLHGATTLRNEILERCAADGAPVIRAWAARLTGERRDNSQAALARLEKLAADPEPSVRLAVAVACRQLVSSSLTVNTDVSTDVPVATILTKLMQSSAAAPDSLIPYTIWLASEPLLAHNPQPGLDWLAENGPATMPLSGILARKAMRRICDTQDRAKLDQTVAFLSAVAERNDQLTLAALDGLIEGQKARPLLPTTNTQALFARLNASRHAQVNERTRQLGTLWGDAGAIERTLALINNTGTPVEERLKAIEAARQFRNDATRTALFKLIFSDQPEPLVIAGLRSLGHVGSEEVGGELVRNWSKMSPNARRVGVEIMVTWVQWTRALLDGLEDKLIVPADVSAGALRSLANYKNVNIDARIAKIFGRVRDADADKARVIAAKKKLVLEGGQPDLTKGREVAQRACFVCHKLNGEGAVVGPDLTGAGRSSLDALLANVIDPNQVIGKGYENVEVETKDGRSVSGRLVEDSDSRVRLLCSGPREEIIAKADIEQMRVSDLSVMPEGLEAQMSDDDFRDMILYVLSAPAEASPGP